MGTRRTDQPTILIMESNPDFCRYIEQHLNQYTCHIATSWKEAQKQYNQLQPDIVFLDSDITDIDPNRLVEDLLEQDASPYIVVMSPGVNDHNKHLYLDAGAKNAIPTPPKETDIVRNIVDFMMGQ